MTRPSLVVDLETVLDPEMPPWEPRSGSDALAPAPFWRIVTIGLAWIDDALLTRRVAVADGDDEPTMLASLIRVVEERRPVLVTFNGRGFDLPIIAARTMRHGLSFPHRFSREVAHRYADGHIDLSDALTDQGGGRPASLDAWARIVGFPGKLGCDGSFVASMVAAGEIERVRAYCMADVAQTAGTWLRHLLARGLPREGYLSAMRSLIAQIDADPRLSMLAEKLNRPRLLLEGT